MQNTHTPSSLSLVLSYLQTFPTPTINLTLQPPRNQTLNAALKPHLPQQRIISLLVQEKLMMSTQRGVHFTVFVKIGRNGPGAVIEIEEEDHAFADMDKETNLTAASVDC
jgi:hypothetical protein